MAIIESKPNFIAVFLYINGALVPYTIDSTKNWNKSLTEKRSRSFNRINLAAISKRKW